MREATGTFVTGKKVSKSVLPATRPSNEWPGVPSSRTLGGRFVVSEYSDDRQGERADYRSLRSIEVGIEVTAHGHPTRGIGSGPSREALKMSRPAALGVMLVLAAASGCDSTVAPPAPPTIAIVEGNNQSAIVRRVLPDPLTVVVTAGHGAAMPGVVVTWTVTAGSGRLSANSVTTDAQGRASVVWTLGAVPGNQAVTATLTGAAGSPANFSAVATIGKPIILRYDGTGWKTALADTAASGVALLSIWGATESDIFAVGTACFYSTLLRSDGTTWSPLPFCLDPVFHGSQSSDQNVSGSSPSNVFVVQQSLLIPSIYAAIYHDDGQQWTQIYQRKCTAQKPCPRAVWSSSRTNAFAVGDDSIMHYDGTDWIAQASGTTASLNAVWGVGPGGPVFAVGTGGTIVYYDGSTWQTQTSPTTQPLFAVWGTSASDVFAVGNSGAIVHYDGTTWTAQNGGSTQNLRGVWGSSGSVVFAVGDGDTILRYDGTTWAAQLVTAGIDLRGVWGSSPTNVFAVGGGS